MIRNILSCNENIDVYHNQAHTQVEIIRHIYEKFCINSNFIFKGKKN